MKKLWWIISFSIHTSTWDGTPDGDNYPVEKKEVFKNYNFEDEKTYDFFYEKILSFLKENYMKKGGIINFIWCLGEEKEEMDKATKLEEFLKEKLEIK